jgi:membrane-associated phospholipid phosphatase
VTALGSAGLNNVIKLLVGRARPRFDDPFATAIGKSFPSGHTQATCQLVVCHAGQLGLPGTG